MLDNSSLYGVGKGDAVAYNPAGAMAPFQQGLARQQQQRQLELKQLTDQQAQLKPDGLRNDADRQDFFNQVNDWRGKSIAAMNERDPYKKSLAQSQAQQAYMQAQATVARSKQEEANWKPVISKLATDPVFADTYADDITAKILANQKLGVNNPNYVSNPAAFEHVADHNKALKDWKELDDRGVKGGMWDNGTITPVKNPLTGQVDYKTQYTQTYDPADRMKDFGLKYDADKNTRKTLYDIYPEIAQNPNLTPVEKKQQLLQKYFDSTGPQINTAKPTDHYAETMAAKMALQENQAKLRQQFPPYATVNNQAPNTVQNYLTDMYKGNEQAGKVFVGLMPTAGMKPGEKPDFNIVNGQHVITKPAIYDTKTLKQMEVDKAAYENRPEKTGSTFGFGGTPIPYEKSDKFKTNQAKYIPKEPAQNIVLPNDETGYRAKATEIANKGGIPIAAVNESGGGHNKAIQSQLKGNQQQAPISPVKNDMINVQLPGAPPGQIPRSKLNEFKKKYPKAQITE